VSECTDRIDELLTDLPGYVTQVEVHVEDGEWGDAITELHHLVSDATHLIQLCTEASEVPEEE
jgi:hypothetical protein